VVELVGRAQVNLGRRFPLTRESAVLFCPHLHARLQALKG
jgi:hypothetical protein